MQLYSVSDEYINYLRKKFPRVYSNKENKRVHTRKYLGTVIENESDQAYKDLINEEIIYIRKHEKKIVKNAKILYSKRKSGERNRVVQNCLNFMALEVECDNWRK